MSKEVWAEIEGYPNYHVSNYGEVHNIKFGRPVKARPNERGYMRVVLSEQGRLRQYYVHQLVAEAFLGGYSHGMQIRHDDGDKSNNHVANLRMRNGRITEDKIPAPRGRPPLGHRVRIVETGEVFLSARECARNIGGDFSSVYRCIREPHRTHRGYHFEFYKE